MARLCRTCGGLNGAPALRAVIRELRSLAEQYVADQLEGLDLSLEALYRPTAGDALALRGEG